MTSLKAFGIGICATVASVMIASSAFAAPSQTRSAKAPIFGSIAADTTGTSGNAGNGIFDWNPGATPADAGAGEVFVDASNVFYGNFWLSNVGWATFNGLGSDGARLVDTWNGDNFNVTWFAWSENAGWIAFVHNTSGVANVTYKKSEGKLHGFAWSPNLGWIPFEGLSLDITPPDAANFNPFAADNNKTFSINDSGDGAGYAYSVSVNPWNSTATNNSYSTTNKQFVHDFRNAKLYNMTVTDPSGNSTSGQVQVVSNIPSETLDAATIGGLSPDGTPIPTQYASSFASTSKVADGIQAHTLSVKLRDKYGNAVGTVPGIRNLAVNLSFSNNVDKNQLPILSPLGGGNLDIGDAISMPTHNFPGLTAMTSGTCSDSTGNCSANITSLAPTKAGYDYTSTNNDISISSMTYAVTPQNGYTGIGEIGSTPIANKVGTNYLKFTPVMSVTTNGVKINNSTSWQIAADMLSQFAVNGTIDNPNNVTISSPKVANVLDLNTYNTKLSFQKPQNEAGGTLVCKAYNETVTTGIASYNKSGTTPSLCNRETPYASSTNVFTPTIGGSAFDLGFDWTPTLISSSPSSNAIKYVSEIQYSVGANSIAYPSFSKDTSSSAGAEGASVQAVKILGFTKGTNIFSVLEDNNVDALGSISRTDLKNIIRKNVANLTKNRTSYTDVNYDYKTTDTTLNSGTWATGKDTYIVSGADVTIDSDIFRGTSKMRGLIVLSENGVGGNVYIKGNVKNLELAIYAEGSLISGEKWVAYYADTRSATDQLYIKGSVITLNTVGGASLTPKVCPEGIATCTDATSKWYDFNFFRFYKRDTDGAGPITGVGSPATGVPSAGQDYPFVIEYDPAIMTTPPVGFTTN